MVLKLMSAVTLSTSSQNKSENSEKLLKQLLECVQDCQKRYGGKNELATEFDSCVAGLCLCLEATFLHGLKTKTQNLSTLKQVSDIVTQTLSPTNECPSFWSFVKRHLTKHEEERYTVLKHIWTDIGRGKAFLRSALNEKSLERYFHTVLSDQSILNEHYEPWAIFQDNDKNSMLPNMAAGLGSILFAVSIDKPELNSGITRRPETFLTKAEPIIEVPIPENKDRNKQKKKRKVARQFISFDDDDSVLSTSVPSCSSSTSSLESNYSLSDHSAQKTRPRHSLNEIAEEIRSRTMDEHAPEPKTSIPKTPEPQKTPKVQRKLSIENSGTREKYTTCVPESLTPVAQSEIGELTPVSVEVNTHFELLDNSDNILEVPSDISAVLSAVENRNQEELSKKEEKISLLVKENTALKEQVKKYLSAIQMLRTDDDGVQTALDGLEIEQLRDYKGEAKIYEQKLVQVAEMHAELMDFNVVLQQSLCKKDLLLERLKSELEELRGPIPTDVLESEDSRGSVHVWIPSAFLTGSGSSSYHVYQIFLRAGNDEWNIYRRYAQFYALHVDLKKLDPIVGSFDFPPKKSIGKKDSSLVEDRRKRFQIYLRKIVAHWPELSHCNSRFLLEQHLAFFKDQRDDHQNKSSVFSSRRSAASNNYSGL